MQVSKPVSDNKIVILLIACGTLFSAIVGCLIGIGRVPLAVSILASALFLAIFLVILRDYRKGWLIFGVLLPLWVLVDFRIPLWVFNIDASMLIIVLTGTAFTLYLFLKKKGYVPQIPYLGIMMLFLMGHLFTSLYGDEIQGLKILVKLCFGIFLYILMMLTIPDIESVGKILKISIITGSIVLVYLTYRYLFVFESSYLGVRILHQTGSGKNQLGILLSLLTPVAISYLVFKKQIHAILIAFIFTAASFYTLSRGTWVSIIASVIFLILFSNRRKSYVLTIALVSLSLLTFMTLLYPSQSRVFLASKAKGVVTLEDVEGGSSIARRKSLLVIGMKSFLERPVFGVGLGNFTQISLNSGMKAYVSHNDYLQILCEQGIIALLIYATLLFKFFRGNLRCIQSCSETGKLWIIEGASASFIALVVHSLFENKYEIMPVWFILGACGLIARTVRKKTNKVFEK